MNKFKAFTGIDISKKSFDAALLFSETGVLHHHCFSQTREGFKSFEQWLKSHEVTLSETLICMEHTGLYTNGIIDFLVDRKANLWVEMAIKIKRSMAFKEEQVIKPLPLRSLNIACALLIVHGSGSQWTQSFQNLRT